MAEKWLVLKGENYGKDVYLVHVDAAVTVDFNKMAGELYKEGYRKGESNAEN